MATSSSSATSPPQDDQLALALAQSMAGVFGMKLVPKDYTCENCVALEREKCGLENQVQNLEKQTKDLIRQIGQSVNYQQNQDEGDSDDLLSEEIQQRVVAQVQQNMIELRCMKDLFKKKWSFEDLLNGKVPQMTIMTPEPSPTPTGTLPRITTASPSDENPVSSTSTAGADHDPNANGTLDRGTSPEGSSSTCSNTSAIKTPTQPYNSENLRQSVRQRIMASSKSASDVDEVPSDHRISRSSTPTSAVTVETRKRKSSRVAKQDEKKHMDSVSETEYGMKTPVIVDVRGSVGVEIPPVTQRVSSNAFAVSHEEDEKDMEVDLRGGGDISGNQENQDQESNVSLDDHVQFPPLSVENSDDFNDGYGDDQDQQVGEDNQGQQDGSPKVIKKYGCLLCRKTYEKIRLLQVHMGKKHPIHSGSEVKCGRCGYLCESLKCFNRHYDFAH